MPLYPVQTYTAWQLACIAAIEPRFGTSPEQAESREEILAEFRTRQIADSIVSDMIALAREIGKDISPVVCMDIDDLEFGILTQFEAGKIDAAEKDRLLAFVTAHVDAPREEHIPKWRARWSDRLMILYMGGGFALVWLSQSNRVFFGWIAGMFAR